MSKEEYELLETTKKDDDLAGGKDTALEQPAEDLEPIEPVGPTTTGPAPVSRATIFFAVSTQIVLAICVTILNKSALNILTAPLCMLGLQAALSAGLLKLFWAYSTRQKQTLGLGSVFQLRNFVFVKILGIVSKTYCLAHVPVSFYQISRGLLLPFTILLSYFLLGQKTYAFPLVGCALVMLGFVSGVHYETRVPFIGVFLGVWSSFTTAIETVAVKHYVHEFPTLDLIYIFSTYMSVFCLCVSVFSHELSSVLLTADLLQLGKFGFAVVASALANFLLNVATFTQIKVTSPVTYMISVASRGVLQTLLAVVCLGEHLYGNRIYGIFFILSGSILYTLAKERERRMIAH
ncbi:triose phosphate transporter [Schizosaccharomyces japonicus yFS275]|uniref:Triose phosphate transporter n=1 Tax=Schizosaccharomyces japonicus (strain yFS275 / FY16936) TaxID=402676 RepID=B6JZD1_SCHJY|nr:triose phosphate transporter [Schizosaccharomyces japonicus yFS275]EEB06899.1 triose phosphate transporter [Schizosaccharomyces japonicus yFS275]